ncbi:MAG TPA: acyl-CoA dehydrogenase family protein, partial [Mycobacteriales bacterium]|nr:acyl-CoA dehydrogenase family protein [Mycobacteriales bacterium]
MSIAVTDDHRALADTAADFLRKHEARAAARALLEAETEDRPAFWNELAGLGWLGLHVPEELGGAGFGLDELVVVVEQLGQAVSPGPFVPTVIASALLIATGDASVTGLVSGLADGSKTGAIALDGELTVRDGTVSGSSGVCLSGGGADLVLVGSGDNVVVVETAAAGVSVTAPPNLDPTRRATRVEFDGAAATVLAGARGALVDIARIVLSAEAVGVAQACTEMAAEYAKVREQFGRPIATYQAVKHHCANMLVATELATAAVWDAARAAVAGGDQRRYAAAVAATLAG